MINFDLTRDRDVIFRRTISAIQLAIKNNIDVAELPNVKVAEAEIDGKMQLKKQKNTLKNSKIMKCVIHVCH